MWKNLLFISILIITSLSSFSKNPWDNISFSNAEIVNEHTTRIPFKLIDHLIVVEAQLLNQKGNFIIDTGSETLILNKAHFATFDPYYKKQKETSGVIELVDNPLERHLSEFSIESLTIKNITSDIIDLSGIEKSKKIHLLGIIGYNILKDYEVFIDMHLNQITLSQVDKKGNRLDQKGYLEKIVDSIPFNLKNHSVVINAFVGDQELKFGLDTGAEYNQLNKNSNKKALKYFFPARRLLLSGVSGKQIEVLAGKLHRVKINDNVYFGPMVTILTNLNKMNEAFGTDLDGVFGYEFFRQKRTIINYQKEKLYFVNYPLPQE